MLVDKMKTSAGARNDEIFVIGWRGDETAYVEMRSWRLHVNLFRRRQLQLECLLHLRVDKAPKAFAKPENERLIEEHLICLFMQHAMSPLPSVCRSRWQTRCYRYLLPTTTSRAPGALLVNFVPEKFSGTAWVVFQVERNLRTQRVDERSRTTINQSINVLYYIPH